MRLAVLIGAAVLVVGAAVALARADPVPAGAAGEDTTGEGVPADPPQPLPRE